MGEQRAPVQTLQLCNDGSGDAQYSIDTSALKQMAADSSGVQVMRCLNPTGTVPANGSKRIEWVFAPLEVREYVAAVSIAVRNGPATLVAVHGAGYDPLSEAAPESDDVALPPTQPLLSDAAPVAAADVVVWQCVHTRRSDSRCFCGIRAPDVLFEFSVTKPVAEVRFLRRCLQVYSRARVLFVSCVCACVVVSFLPASGLLPAHSSVVTDVLVYGHTPRVIDDDIVCRVRRVDGIALSRSLTWSLRPHRRLYVPTSHKPQPSEPPRASQALALRPPPQRQWREREQQPQARQRPQQGHGVD